MTPEELVKKLAEDYIDACDDEATMEKLYFYIKTAREITGINKDEDPITY